MASNSITKIAVFLSMILCMLSSYGTCGHISDNIVGRGISNLIVKQTQTAGVQDLFGNPVVFGANNTFSIYPVAFNDRMYPGFYFGLGTSGEQVFTDTAITMGMNGDASRITACRNGQLVYVAASSVPPADALFYVRFNATLRLYYLEVTNDGVPVQFARVASGVNDFSTLLCNSALAASSIAFINDAASANINARIAHATPIFMPHASFLPKPSNPRNLLLSRA